MLFSPSPKDEQLIAALRRSGKATLDPAARSWLRARVVAAAATVTPDDRGRWKEQKRPLLIFHLNPMIALLIAVILLTSGVGTAAAADRAKPGDALFGLDRALEQVRLKLTVREDARAKFVAKIAEERDQERRATLEEDDDRVRIEAEERSRTALDQAIATVSRVRVKLETKGNGRAAETLIEVEAKLRTLEDEREDRDEAIRRGLTEAEVKIFATTALVTIEFNDVKSVFKVASTDVAVILEEIVKRTGVPAEKVKAILKVEHEAGTEANENENETENRNGNANQNANGNTNAPGGAGSGSAGNTNASGPGNGQTASWEIEVKVEDGQAEIKTRRGDDRQEWTLFTSDQTTILASIAARTGLATAEIQSFWQFRVED